MLALTTVAARAHTRSRDSGRRAATMTRTEVAAVDLQSEMHNRIPVPELVKLVHENLTAIGPP